MAGGCPELAPKEAKVRPDRKVALWFCHVYIPY